MPYMNSDTRFHNASRAATKWRETTPKHEFWTSSSGLGMFVAKKQEIVLVAQTHALYTHRYPFSQWVTCGNEMA